MSAGTPGQGTEPSGDEQETVAIPAAPPPPEDVEDDQPTVLVRAETDAGTGVETDDDQSTVQLNATDGADHEDAGEETVVITAAGSPAPPIADRPAESDGEFDAGPPPAAESDAAPLPPQESEAATAAGAAEAATTRTSAPTRSRWAILRGPVAVAFLLASLGFALAAQLSRDDADESRLTTLRQSDLVRILDELDARERRLRDEISDLEFRHQTLTSRAQGSEAALADAQRRASELGILSGTVSAEGPGLVVRISEDGGRLTAQGLLDTVQELRGAGAEAMEITGANGSRVRIGASSFFVDSGKGIEVDGQVLVGPYVVVAIGDPQTMDRALKIPGGVVTAVRQDGCTISLEQRRTVQITAVRKPRAPRFAQPAS